MPKKLTHTEVINKFNKAHGIGSYDYSLVVYKNSTTKVDITCQKHGLFKQQPFEHYNGSGCPLCAGDRISKSKTKTLGDVLIKFKKAHGGKYNYSNVKYIGCSAEVEIVCNKHGVFWQVPQTHWSGHGCPKCGFEKRGILSRLGQVDFERKAKKVHGEKYDYSKSVYIKNSEKVCIICKDHGEFWQIPNSHLLGHGCSACRSEKIGWTADDFYKRCNGKEALLYVVLCSGNNELFFKVGITGKKISERLHKSFLPYDYDVIFSTKSDPVNIFNMEDNIHKYHKSDRYKPSLSFGGATECFNSIDMGYIKDYKL